MLLNSYSGRNQLAKAEVCVFFSTTFLPHISVIYLKDNENAAYDTSISINHGLLHDVTNAAQMVGFNWMLLAQDTCDGKIGVGGQEIELVYAHGTNVVQ